MNEIKNILEEETLCQQIKRETKLKVQSSINPNRNQDLVKNVLLTDMDETFRDCMNIAISKNSDYGATDKDPYNNFTNSKLVGVSVEKGIMVRMMDKISRINTLLEKENKVKDESINDTLNDLINYTAILKSYLKNK